MCRSRLSGPALLYPPQYCFALLLPRWSSSGSPVKIGPKYSDVFLNSCGLNLWFGAFKWFNTEHEGVVTAEWSFLQCNPHGIRTIDIISSSHICRNKVYFHRIFEFLLFFRPRLTCKFQPKRHKCNGIVLFCCNSVLAETHKYIKIVLLFFGYIINEVGYSEGILHNTGEVFHLYLFFSE